jgi:RNA polymerase sigma-70 factor (ECF subfamily)
MTDRAAAAQYNDVARAQATAEAAETPASEAFDRMYREEFPYVWRSLRRLGGRPADLEDLAHDVFVVVHKRLADYDESRPLRAWLFGIAFRVASDYRRRARFRAEVATGDVEATSQAPRADDQLAAEQDRALVIEALAALDLDRRAVFVLHDIDGVAAPAIADALAIPVNTVYSRLRIARERFAAAVRRLRARRGER